MSTEHLSAQLEGHLGEAWGRPTVVTGLTRLTSGASRETWVFTAAAEECAPRRLVLRLDPVTEPRPELVVVETQVLQAAARSGVPVASVVSASSEPAALGAPFLIMSYVPGESMPRRILRDEQLRAVREGLAAECGRILGRIHATPLQDLEAVPRVDALSTLWDTYIGYGQLRPAMEIAFGWLADHRPAAREDQLVHGDFRNGNLIVSSSGIAAVLDWEQVHRGDALEDLGWLCVRAWRYGAAPVVGGLGTYTQLLDGYEATSGERVDPEALRWWEVFGTLRWGVMCIHQAHRHLSGSVRSLDLLALGRRICEQEYDVLNLIASPLGVLHA